MSSACAKVLVSCRGINGENNVLAVAYCGNCSYDPPMVMVGIVPSRYSYKMIRESGCFVVNLVSREYKETFDYYFYIAVNIFKLREYGALFDRNTYRKIDRRMA